VTVLEIVFWVSLGLIVYSQIGYPLALWILQAFKRPQVEELEQPPVSLIVAAHNEEDVIADKIANALALDYPRERLQVIVTCDGSTDGTAQLARDAGADLVLENPRGGKVRAQDAAVRVATGDVVAFSDANATWEPDALKRLVAAFDDPRVGYVCGRVGFVNAGGTSQEGLYWRYELWLRAQESRLCSITAGNGAIYATRREAYVEVDPVMGHDLRFPFDFVKRGWRASFQPTARATELMVPDVEGEAGRKRRMMGHGWPIVLRGGLLRFRGYPPLYGLFIFSHRLLRYASPFLHAVALATNIALVAVDPTTVYGATLVAQLLLLAAVPLARVVRVKPLLVARYYVLTTAALGLGLYDWLRHGTEAGWDPAEGTR
jgi:cellulose synthase/poly-beta-1,6-N-acetylglucosamine synthase-like glycosyltransferase